MTPIRHLTPQDCARLFEEHKLTPTRDSYLTASCGCLLGVLAVAKLRWAQANEALAKARLQCEMDGTPVAQTLGAASGLDPSYAQGLNDGFSFGGELHRGGVERKLYKRGAHDGVAVCILVFPSGGTGTQRPSGAENSGGAPEAPPSS